jgi:hypothetical protein
MKWPMTPMTIGDVFLAGPGMAIAAAHLGMFGTAEAAPREPREVAALGRAKGKAKAPAAYWQSMLHEAWPSRRAPVTASRRQSLVPGV